MNKLEPKIKDRKKFDLDLKYGQVKEKIVADMLQDKKIEVKSERGMWLKTGNIAIEYESYGKPSGIATTESDYWFHNLCVDEKNYATLVFKTDMLKQIVEQTNDKKTVSGGDHNASKMYLMNIQNIFSSDIIKKSIDNNN